MIDAVSARDGVGGGAASGDGAVRAAEREIREIDVVVALLRDAEGRWLVTSRPEGKELAGWWEFPGGKRAATEEPFAALVRELDEELGVAVEAAEARFALVHCYPDKRVRLDVWLVTRFSGTPQPREGQALRWVRAGELEAVALLPADRPIVESLCSLEQQELE